MSVSDHNSAVCCFCGESLPLLTAAVVTVRTRIDAEESQDLYAHRACLRQRIQIDVPLLTELEE